jgi:hypothetical protein
MERLLRYSVLIDIINATLQTIDGRSPVRTIKGIVSALVFVLSIARGAELRSRVLFSNGLVKLELREENKDAPLIWKDTVGKGEETVAQVGVEKLTIEFVTQSQKDKSPEFRKVIWQRQLMSPLTEDLRKLRDGETVTPILAVDYYKGFAYVLHVFNDQILLDISSCKPDDAPVRTVTICKFNNSEYPRIQARLIPAESSVTILTQTKAGKVRLYSVNNQAEMFFEGNIRK